MKRYFRKYFIAFAILTILLISACSSVISKQEAENNALKFIKARVKFFTRDTVNSNSSVDYVKLERVTSYMEGKDWIVVAHVVSEINQTLKQGDITVKIDSKNGNVLEFNGVKVVIPKESVIEG